MYLFLLEPQNIIIQDHDQDQEKENESQVWVVGNGNADLPAFAIIHVNVCKTWTVCWQ